MRSKNLISFCLVLMFGYSLPTNARTDVKAKVQQLQENVEASKINLDQYESNLKTVVSNLAETEKALKAIEKQRIAITKQTGQSAKDQSTVQAARTEVETLLKQEREKMAAEDRQLEELKATVVRLEANRQKRQTNIAAYEERLKKVDTDQSTWTDRNQSIVDLEQALKVKEDEARSEKKRLLAKKAEYEEEIAKWKKQQRTSEREAGNFSKLKDP